MTREQEVRARIRAIMEKQGFDPRRPGPFEGEDISTLYFHDLYMDGDGEYRGVEDDNYQVFDVDAAERRVLKLKATTKYFVLSFSGSGFVSGTEMDEHDYGVFDADVSELEEGESEENY